ncbi:MAG: MOSC domain-containing protein [Actinomycetota bacterium]|nr:MOSC domain-containing protein [Actinomycetota bacterium]
MESSATLRRISIAPVKGMRLRSLEQVELTRQGIPGDRAFFVVDEKRRMVNGKRLGALMTIVPDHDLETGILTLEFPEDRISARVDLGEPQAVTFFGLQIQARPVLGPFSDAISGHVGHEVRLMERPENRPAVDRGAIAGVTLLGAASVERLEEEAKEFEQHRDSAEGWIEPGKIDSRRFRMSLEFDGPGPHAEDEWVGREVRVGEARIAVAGHVGRCAVTTRDPESGAADLRTLHYLKKYRDRVQSEEALPFGVYARILEPGTIRIGDAVTPL